MAKNKLGIYIHLPFCLKKCNYCDFCSYTNVSDDERERYIAAVGRHIEKYAKKRQNHAVDTIYFGGGTPTLLKTTQFEKIFSFLRENFDIASDAEITVECNPATADREKFKALKNMGVNRLSIGVQSVNDNELAALGRVHKFSDVEKTFADARAAGFDNVSADIMFGIPEQTEESFKKTLERVVGFAPTHISAYGLILERGTPFYKNRKKLVFPDEDSEYNMYSEAVSFLKENGYYRYEISNFAKPGFESKHNLKYWRSEEYLGFGVAAHSFFGGRRFYSPKKLSSYIGGRFVAGSSTVSEGDAMAEYVMLAMRTSSGVNEEDFYKKFGKKFGDIFGEKLEPFCRSGLVVRESGRCVFTDKGFYLSNAVLSEILEFDK